MKSLVLHPKTKRQLELAANRRPQVLLLRGKPGVGLYTIAWALAQDISDKHNVLEIEPDEKGAIKIDVIRQLYSQTRTKRERQLIILIDNADTMLAAAQNALLKLLEETPKNTMFLLTTHYPQLLLPTVRSRAQEVEVLPVSDEQTLGLIKKAGPLEKTKLPQLLFLGQGLPAELARIINDKDYQEQRVRQMREAKDFLTKSLYEKLVIIYKLPSDRAYALTLIQDVMRIVEITLKSKADPALASLLRNLLQTEQKLHNDGHVKTQLLDLAIKLN